MERTSYKVGFKILGPQSSKGWNGCKPKPMFNKSQHITEKLNFLIGSEVEHYLLLSGIATEAREYGLKNIHHMTGFVLNSRRPTCLMSHYDYPAM